MHYAASAYSRTAQTGQTPRELEASILMKSASRLQGIRDDWANRSGDLDEALTYNRKLWTVLVSSATRPENPLPTPIKQNVVNLGLFIFNHTLSLMASPAPERIGILVSINRELAAGLRGMGVPEESAAA
jgi:flagellar biosynthesis activator protein FlaF